MEFAEIIKFLEKIKVFFDIAGPVVIIILAILTYRQAKKTIFTPLKTETFKLQLKLFEDILLFFDSNKNNNFIRSFDFDRIFKMNYAILLNTYFEKVLEIKIDKSQFEHNLKNFPFMNIAPKYANRFSKTDGEIIFTAESAKSKAKNKLEKWAEFECISINYSAQFEDKMHLLNKFICSPIVTKTIKKKLQEFRINSYQNLHIMAETITIASKMLPSKYPDQGALPTITDSWVWNMYVEKSNRLEPISEDIFNEINKYLNIDNILN